jgi:16S rRNA (guanine527-N7)-methyltransferase
VVNQEFRGGLRLPIHDLPFPRAAPVSDQRPPPRPPPRPPLDPLAGAPDAPLPAPADFLDAAAAIGVAFEPGEVEALGRYLALLLHANEVMNLTAIKAPVEAWTRHILDALTLLPLLAELAPGALVVDVGSGGGVPGIPLAIVRPDLKVTLIESTQKKAAFLEACARRLGLGNVEVRAQRAEEAGRSDLRETADLVCARAVGRLATLVELTLPLVRGAGRAVFIKGAAADEELEEAGAAIRMLGGAHAGTLPTPTGRIVAIEKVRGTGKMYPRRAGEPKRAPLGVTRKP